MEFSEKPRDIRDYRAALRVIDARILRPDVTDPELLLQLTTIREGLQRLIMLLQHAAQAGSDR